MVPVPPAEHRALTAFCGCGPLWDPMPWPVRVSLQSQNGNVPATVDHPRVAAAILGMRLRGHDATDDYRYMWCKHCASAACFCRPAAYTLPWSVNQG